MNSTWFLKWNLHEEYHSYEVIDTGTYDGDEIRSKIEFITNAKIQNVCKKKNWNSDIRKL